MSFAPNPESKQKVVCSKCGTTDQTMFAERSPKKCRNCIANLHRMGKIRELEYKVARDECMDCGLKITHQNALLFDWDHRDPSIKRMNVSKMAKYGMKSFQDEIAKCDLVCVMDHRLRTIERGPVKTDKRIGRPPKENVPVI